MSVLRVMPPSTVRSVEVQSLPPEMQARARSNLPARLTSFIGRTIELEELQLRIREHGRRTTARAEQVIRRSVSIEPGHVIVRNRKYAANNDLAILLLRHGEERTVDGRGKAGIARAVTIQPQQARLTVAVKSSEITGGQVLAA